MNAKQRRRLARADRRKEYRLVRTPDAWGNFEHPCHKVSGKVRVPKSIRIKGNK